MSEGFLGLADEEFWSDPLRTREAVTEAMMSTGFRGLRLDGPASVPVATRDTLPLVGVRACSTDDAVRLNLHLSSLLCVVRLESNECFVALAFPWKGNPPPSPPRAAGAKSGSSCGAFVIEATTQIPELPWRPGTLLSTVVLFDQRSDRVRTRLVGPETSDPEVARFLESQRKPAYPRSIWPAASQHGARYYGAIEGAPPRPEAPGIALSVERVKLIADGARLPLRASFTLPALPREIVRPLPELQDAGPNTDRWRDPGDPDATAVLPITLVISGEREVGPYVYALHVPSYDAIREASSPPVVGGSFEIDLLALPDGPRLPQTYAIWAFSGEVMAGPTKTALVTEDMLPPPGE